jgi:hypothetical protein
MDNSVIIHIERQTQMPAIRSYVVRETRQLRISATNPAEAVKEAATYFDMGTSGGYDNIPVIRTVDISATEE